VSWQTPIGEAYEAPGDAPGPIRFVKKAAKKAAAVAPPGSPARVAPPAAATACELCVMMQMMLPGMKCEDCSARSAEINEIPLEGEGTDAAPGESASPPAPSIPLLTASCCSASGVVATALPHVSLGVRAQAIARTVPLVFVACYPIDFPEGFELWAGLDLPRLHGGCLRSSNAHFSREQGGRSAEEARGT
jgi:hypothetical protein